MARRSTHSDAQAHSYKGFRLTHTWHAADGTYYWYMRRHDRSGGAGPFKTVAAAHAHIDTRTATTMQVRDMSQAAQLERIAQQCNDTSAMLGPTDQLTEYIDMIDEATND